jgi:hypothetical protein
MWLLLLFLKDHKPTAKLKPPLTRRGRAAVVAAAPAMTSDK